jgi:ferredoxin
MPYRIDVDPDLCIASKNCVHCAAAVFQLNEDQVAAVLDPDGAPDPEVVEAARNCPVDAIRLYDRVTGAQVYP